MSVAVKKCCTECGGAKAQKSMQKHRDATDVVHWFHPACWERLCRWMAGDAVERKVVA